MTDIMSAVINNVLTEMKNKNKMNLNLEIKITQDNLMRLFSTINIKIDPSASLLSYDIKKICTQTDPIPIFLALQDIHETSR